ncbi:MAG: class I SAM-dependent methyltransferase, partial [Desulfobacterales bacterium]
MEFDFVFSRICDYSKKEDIMSTDWMSEGTIEKSDIFDFMANYVGFSVLHPGGFSATEILADECEIDKQTRVLDIACGKGTSSIFLAQKYGCRVEGLDISEDLIKEARDFAKQKGISD